MDTTIARKMSKNQTAYVIPGHTHPTDCWLVEALTRIADARSYVGCAQPGLPRQAEVILDHQRSFGQQQTAGRPHSPREGE